MRLTGILLAATAALTLAACDNKPATPTTPVAEAPSQPPAPKLDLTANPSQGDGGAPDFYSKAPPLPDMIKAGTYVHGEQLPADLSLAESGRGDRFTYISTNGLDSKSPVLVSGAIWLPKSEKPADGWPLIAWAHGTVGIADACAPSNNKRSDRDQKYLNHWLEQGYAVVASDYQGLGTPGGHPYLTTKPEAYSVLDSIRAVQSQADYGLSKKVVLVGQSQGGGAAFATAGVAGTYAPDLDIRGTVATGTPYFTTTQAPVERDPKAVEGVFSYTLLILFMIEQVDPSFHMADYVTPAAGPTLEKARTSCLMDTWNQVLADKLSFSTAFSKDPTPFTSKYYGLMAYDTLKVKGPVFMGTGGKDHDVPPPGQDRLFADACKAGSIIERHVYPQLDHSGTVNGSLNDSTPFVKKAFAGEPIAGNCAK